MVEAGECRDAEKQGVDEHGRAHPQQQHEEQHQTEEEHLRAGPGAHQQHAGESHRPSFPDGAAFLVAAEREEGRDDHEAGERGKEDVVVAGFDEREHERP